MIPLPTFAPGDTGVAASPPPPGDIAYVGGNTGRATGVSSYSLAQPAGVQAGDFGIISARGSNGAITLPSGWTQLATNMFCRVYPAGQGSVTLAAASGDIAGAIQVWRNVHQASPINASSFGGGSSGQSSFASTEITATHNGSVLAVALRGISGTAATVTPPTGFTGVSNAQPSFSYQWVGMAFKAGFNNGSPSGTPAWTSSPAANGGVSVGYFMLRWAGS